MLALFVSSGCDQWISTAPFYVIRSSNPQPLLRVGLHGEEFYVVDALLIGPGTRGLSLGYGILIRQGEIDLGLLSHECRHVPQVEAAGSLEAFLVA